MGDVEVVAVNNNQNINLKPCPFCGSNDVRFSMKVSGSYNLRYRATMYCNKCHCYGPRTLTEDVYQFDYPGRDAIQSDEKVHAQAEYAWNRRATDGE